MRTAAGVPAGAVRRERVSWVLALAPGALLVLLLAPIGTGATAVLYLAAMLTALGAIALRGVLVPAGRAAWLLLAAGAAVLLGVQALLLAGAGGAGGAGGDGAALRGVLQEHPVLAVAGLAGYPLLYAAQLQLLRQRVQRLLPGAWLDRVLIAVLLMALVEVFVLPPLRQASGTGALAASALVGRVALDVLMLSFALANGALTGWRSDRRLVLVAAAFALLLLADTAGLVRTAGLLQTLWPSTGSQGAALEVLAVLGALIDTGRFAALLLLAVAAWREPAAVRERTVEGWPVLVAPTLALVLSVGLLCWHLRTPLPGAAAELALVVVLLVGVKVLVVFGEVLRLADSRRQALSDELTGLPNRRALQQRLRTATSGRAGVERGQDRGPDRGQDRGGGRGRASTGTSLLLIDLDHFKDVNDSLGHECGDDLLRQVAARMAAVVPPGALLARLGGDEFAVVLAGLPGVSGTSGADLRAGEDVAEEAAEEAGEQLLRALSAPFTVGGVSVRVGASIGIAAWPFPCPHLPALARQGCPREPVPGARVHGRSGEQESAVAPGAELLRRADAAMYVAKRGGGGLARYDEASGQAARQRLQRVGELRAGIAAGEL
ncbi:diguanylate cyclase domain-containing protein, partial [Kineococcus sp. SYSU DK005]|uniref:diguanylate cyclase domain-containing protein n=1 Tax=Kineococcus sp. SYSU DK005 TaxID=3383126 RepID=UPI003D7DA72F